MSMTENAQTTAAATPETTAKNPRRHALIYGCLALLALSQLGLGAYVWTQTTRLTPPAATDATATTIEAIKAALNGQQEQLSQMQAQLAAAPAPSSNAEAIERFNLQQQSLSELQARIDALEQAKLASPQTSTAASLDEIGKAGKEMRQLKALIEGEYAAKLQDIQLLTAFDRLQERVFAEETYDQALAAFRVASESLPVSKEWIAALKAQQLEGAASWSQLQSQFESARNAATEAQLPAEPPTPATPDEPASPASIDRAKAQAASLWQSVRSNLSSLVSIRKTGNTHQGNDLESVLARAEFALQQQDEQGIIAELEALTPEQRAFFAEFEASLQRRQGLFALMNDIRLYLQARLQQPMAGE